MSIVETIHKVLNQRCPHCSSYSISVRDKGRWYECNNCKSKLVYYLRWPMVRIIASLVMSVGIGIVIYYVYLFYKLEFSISEFTEKLRQVIYSLIPVWCTCFFCHQKSQTLKFKDN